MRKRPQLVWVCGLFLFGGCGPGTESETGTAPIVIYAMDRESTGSTTNSLILEYPEDTGYDHTIEQVGTVRAESAEALVEYYDAVHEVTVGYLRGLSATDLDRVVDERWDPPVTLGVRLVSVADDDIQHAGQAAYARGLLDPA